MVRVSSHKMIHCSAPCFVAKAAQNNCNKLKRMATCYIRLYMKKRKKKDSGKEWKHHRRQKNHSSFCWTTNSRLVIKSLLLPHNKHNFCDDKAWEQDTWHKWQTNGRKVTQADGNFSRRPRRGVVCVCVCWQRCLLACESADSLLWFGVCVTLSVLLQSSCVWESKLTLKNSCPLWLATQSLLCSNKCEWVIKSESCFLPMLLN